MKIHKPVTIALACLLAACTSLSEFGANLASYIPGYSANDVQSIGLFLQADPSLNRAIEVDVVFVYGKDAQVSLSNIDASQWFAQKPAYLASFAQQIATLHWELVEGFSQSTDTLPDKHKDAFLVLVFANNPNNKVDITTLETPWLVLDGTSIKVQAKPPGVSNL